MDLLSDLRKEHEMRVLAFLIGAAAFASWTLLGYPTGVTSRVPVAAHADGPVAVTTQPAVPLDPSTVAQAPVEPIDQTIVDPWDRGGLLPYLLYTMNPEEQAGVTDFVKTFSISPDDIESMRATARMVTDRSRALVHPTDADLLAIGAAADSQFRQIAGPRYSAMRSWLLDWYVRNAMMRRQQQQAIVASQKKSQAPISPVAR